MREQNSSPLDLVHLRPLMQRTAGSPELKIGMIDGPVALAHPELAASRILELPGPPGGSCTAADSAACRHGTFVAGILAAKRGSSAPAICPDCTLILRPVFREMSAAAQPVQSAPPEALAAAIIECVEAGVRVINLSVVLAQRFGKGELELMEALDHAARRAVIVVAAAGNQGTLGSTSITRHSWVIPVVAFGRRAMPMVLSNLGVSMGRRGLGAPGDAILSLGADGRPLAMSGTSAAAPFVTGAIALLWSEFPRATAVAIKSAVTRAAAPRRTTVVPPLLDAWASYQYLLAAERRPEPSSFEPRAGAAGTACPTQRFR